MKRDFSRKTNQQLESTGEILRGLGIVAPWIEQRGRKEIYFFHHMKPGQIERRPVSIKKSRAVHTAMLKAARRQGFKITIQNHGNFLLIKRLK